MAAKFGVLIQANNIERVHLQFCKSLLGVKRSTQNDFIYGELGRINYKTRRLFIAIKYWLKLTGLTDRKYNYIVYKLMLNDLELRPNKTNWASLVKQLLFSLGLNYAWYAQGVGNVNYFLTIVKQRLNDQFMQNWKNRLTMSSRATFYEPISEFRFQPYLNIINVTKFRTAVTRLRVSSHRLEIETGKWHKPNKIPRVDRKCSECNLLEDEYHLLFECVLYNDLRKQYFKPYFSRRSSMFKTINLMKSDNTKDIKNLATYVFKAFELRTSLLF